MNECEKNANKSCMHQNVRVANTCRVYVHAYARFSTDVRAADENRHRQEVGVCEQHLVDVAIICKHDKHVKLLHLYIDRVIVLAEEHLQHMLPVSHSSTEICGPSASLTRATRWIPLVEMPSSE
jgi:hypothetical protein